MQDINQKSCIMHHESLKIKAPAKINLGLKVIGLRTDGYHEIETTMQMVGLFDEISFEMKDRGIKLLVEGEDISKGRENIVYKACELLRKKAGGKGVKIKLRKNIPLSAGLGGGSSDGAATLVGLNRLWGLGLDREELMHLGCRLGSDVPFFLFGPSALARGRGEILTRVRPLNKWILLVNPTFPVATSWVYNSYDRSGEKAPNTKILTKRKDSIKLPRLNKRFGGYSNDLEKVTGSNYPVIERIKKDLINSGAEASLMSGSGPTVFGIFSEKRSTEKASERFKGYKVFVVKTLTKSPF